MSLANLIRNTTVKEALAEFLGTAVLMIFGIGSVAQFVLSEGTTGSTDQVRWSWGLGVAFGVYVAGGISGGHLNPAVTLTLCLFKRVPWSKLFPYWLGQYLGSFTASCLVYLVYYDAFSTFKGGNHTIETASIFSTYPQSYLSVANGLGDQIFGTAVLMLLVLAVTDENNMSPGKGYLPLIVGLVVVAIGMTFSHNCGYAINPARDLSPRFFTFIAGWGRQVFSVNDYRWFWIPVLGPYLGAIVGGTVYEVCINLNIPCCAANGNLQIGTLDVSVTPITSPEKNYNSSTGGGSQNRNSLNVQSSGDRESLSPDNSIQLEEKGPTRF